MFLCVTSQENQEWFDEEPATKAALFEGYKAVIPDVMKDISRDHRIMKNNHILNIDFREEPKFFAGFYVQPDNLLVLSCIYVFPKFRHQGLGSWFLNALQHQFQEARAIQVAVYADKNESLKNFYYQHGFISSGKAKSNLIGQQFVDYFWSSKPIELKEISDGYLIERVSSN